MGPAPVRVEADPGYTVIPSDLPPAPLATVAAPSEVAYGDDLPFTGSCPPTTPAADRVLIRQDLRRNPDGGALAYEEVPVAPDGSVAASVAPLRPDNPYDHGLAMWCMAGDRFLGRPAGLLFRVAPPAPGSSTTPTVDATSTTGVASTPGTAPGAVPVPGFPGYTG